MKTAHEDVLSLLTTPASTWDQLTGWQFTWRGPHGWNGAERRVDPLTAQSVELALGFEQLGDAHVGVLYLACMGIGARLCERVLFDAVHRKPGPASPAGRISPDPVRR